MYTHSFAPLLFSVHYVIFLSFCILTVHLHFQRWQINQCILSQPLFQGLPSWASFLDMVVSNAILILIVWISLISTSLKGPGFS